MVLPGPESRCTVPWLLENFCYIFLPNIDEDQKNLTFWARGPLHCAYGNSGSGYCITFITKLNKGLRLQFLEQTALFFAGYSFKLVGKYWMWGVRALWSSILILLLIRGGVLKDVLEDTFSSSWPRPQTLQVLENVLSSARGQHYLWLVEKKNTNKR